MHGAPTFVLRKGSNVDLLSLARYLEGVHENGHYLTHTKLYVVCNVFMPCALCTWILNLRTFSSRIRAMFSSLTSIGLMIYQRGEDLQKPTTFAKLFSIWHPK
eukprot:TsM_001238300 transcript=TsM_001238300 gene=TsM_001238300